MPPSHRFIFLVTKDRPRCNIHVACGSTQSLQLSALKKFGMVSLQTDTMAYTAQPVALQRIPQRSLYITGGLEKADTACCASCSGKWPCPCQCCTCRLFNFYFFGWLHGCLTPHKCAMQCHCHSPTNQPMGRHCRPAPRLCSIKRNRCRSCKQVMAVFFLFLVSCVRVSKRRSSISPVATRGCLMFIIVWRYACKPTLLPANQPTPLFATNECFSWMLRMFFLLDFITYCILRRA